jgi:hypothetical protein
MAAKMLLLKGEDVGAVKLGGLVLPGVFQSMQIRGELRVDEGRVRGRSGTSKRPMGFDDVEATLTLRCCSDDDTSADAKAGQIVKMFRQQDRQAKPYTYDITHARLNDAWGVRTMMIRSCQDEETNEVDTVDVVIVMAEHVPTQARRKESRVVADSTVAEGMTTPEMLKQVDWFARGASQPQSITPTAEQDAATRRDEELANRDPAIDEDDPRGS